MTNITKRIISTLLTLCMLFLAAVPAFAARWDEEYLSDLRLVYAYDYVDAKGNLIEEVCISEGELEYSYEYTYDEHGHITKAVYDNGEGSIDTKTLELKLVYISLDVTEQIKDIFEFNDL